MLYKKSIVNLGVYNRSHSNNIKTTVKNHFKFKICQQIGWRKLILKIITKKEKNIRI